MNNRYLKNEELANAIADTLDRDFDALLGVAQARLGDDGDLYCVSSAAVINFIRADKYSSMKIAWLLELRQRLLNLDAGASACLFDVRFEDYRTEVEFST